MEGERAEPSCTADGAGESAVRLEYDDSYAGREGTAVERPKFTMLLTAVQHFSAEANGYHSHEEAKKKINIIPDNTPYSTTPNKISHPQVPLSAHSLKKQYL